MNNLIPWKNNAESDVEKIAFNLVNIINFSIQRLNSEQLEIYEQLNHSAFTSEEIMSAMGDSRPIFTAYKLATQAYLTQLETLFGAPGAIAPTPTFAEKLQELTKSGYTDPVTGIKIKGGDEEMTRRWAPSITSILNMKSLGLPGTTPFQFTDFDDVPHTVTFDEFQQLMARYSVWFNEQFANASSP